MGLVRTAAYSDIVIAAAKDTYVTCAAIIVPATQGYGARLRGFTVGMADETAQDIQMSVIVNRINDVSAGSAGTPGTTISAANLARPYSYENDGNLTVGLNYVGAEPSTFLTYPLFMMDFNSRGGYSHYFQDFDTPYAGEDQILAIRVAPRVATAAQVSGTIIFEELG